MPRRSGLPVEPTSVDDLSMTSGVLLADRFGSTMFLPRRNDASGNSQKSYQCDVYVEVTGGFGSLSQEFDFAGQQTDPTGLQYLRARYYDSETGTFVTRDPLALLPSWQESSFGYVGGAPTNWSDPTGLYWGEGAVKGVKKAVKDTGKSLVGPDVLTTVLQIADVIPIAEICFGVAFGGLAATGAGAVAATVGGLLAYKACGPIEQLIGSAAFAASTAAIARAKCSEQEKIGAQGVNYMNFMADAPQIPFLGEFLELEAYLTQARICPSSGEYPRDQSRQ